MTQEVLSPPAFPWLIDSIQTLYYELMVGVLFSPNPVGHKANLTLSPTKSEYWSTSKVDESE